MIVLSVCSEQCLRRAPLGSCVRTRAGIHAKSLRNSRTQIALAPDRARLMRSHPSGNSREAAAELARTDRALRQSSQNRFARIPALLPKSPSAARYERKNERGIA